MLPTTVAICDGQNSLRQSSDATGKMPLNNSWIPGTLIKLETEPSEMPAFYVTASTIPSRVKIGIWMKRMIDGLP